MRPDPLLQFGGVGLDPSKNGGVSDRDAAILQHKFEIAVAGGELEIPAHGPKDHLGGELSSLELLASPPPSPSSFGLQPHGSYRRGSSAQTLQQNLSILPDCTVTASVRGGQA